MIVRTLLGVSAALFLWTPLGFACSCGSSPGCPTLGGPFGPVFVGTVLEVTETGNPAFLSGRRARIQVSESFGGLSPEAKEIDVLTGRGGGDCGVPFKPGEQYLVAAFLSKDGLIHAGICSSTRRIDSIGAALRILRLRRSGQALPSLAGQIVQRDRNFIGHLGTHQPRPLGNTLIRVRREGTSYETLADAEGLYEFYGLPPGRYEFVPELPQGTTLSFYIGSDGPQIPFEVGPGCRERDIEVFASGSIQGQVVDESNRPLPHAFVYIVPADRNVIAKERELYWESQGKDGYFKFVHLPPGRYLVLVNPDNSQKPDFPYPRTFYPGVQEREAATVITVLAGAHVKKVDIRLQQHFVPRHVGVRVAWADGRPIRSFVYVVARGLANRALQSDASTDEENSLGHLKLVPTEAYEVHAKLTCQYADARSLGPGAKFTSSKVHLRPGDGQHDLTLMIPATGCPVLKGKTLVTGQ